MSERALGSFFSGTFLIPRTIRRKIIQKINMMMRAPINLKRFSQVRKPLIQLIKEEVCSMNELPAFFNPSDTSSMLILQGTFREPQGPRNTNITYYTLIAPWISSGTDISSVQQKPVVCILQVLFWNAL